MRELDDTALERRLREVLDERLGALPLELTVETLNRRQAARGDPRRFGRGRGMTLLAAAALVGGGALAAGSGILRLPSVVPPVPSPSVVAVATASPDATSPGPSESAAPSASPIAVAGPGGVWIPTGSMLHGGNNAVRLLDGRVLVVGGSGAENDPSTAELYDPASGTWSATGNMLKPMAGFPPTLLRDGRVLVGDAFEDRPDHEVVGAELYDPATGTWSSTGKLATIGNWLGQTSRATLLADGRVLLSGSHDYPIQSDSQLFDPDSGTWTATGSMTEIRWGHAAVLLPDGRVLVAGGVPDYPPGGVNSAELYDPDTASWTAIANMHAHRGEITATQLADGKVLVYGGRNRSNSEEPFSAELYDPATGVWTDAGDLASPDATYSTATRLLDGGVLLSGDSRSRDAERYDPRTGTWTAVGSMLRQHGDFPATPLLDGTVLVAGGSDCLDDRCVASGAAELYVPAGVSLPPLPAFPSPAPPVFPSPTPVPTPFPPAAGPVPPNARTWTVTVVNNSSNPTTLFVADETERGTLGRLVGSVTPNVVPPGSTVEVTFTLPAKGVEGWAIFVNARPDEGSLVGAAEVGIPGKILVGGVGGSGEIGWVSP
jgi:hypothetical protein